MAATPTDDELVYQAQLANPELNRIHEKGISTTIYKGPWRGEAQAKLDAALAEQKAREERLLAEQKAREERLLAEQKAREAEARRKAAEEDAKRAVEKAIADIQKKVNAEMNQ